MAGSVLTASLLAGVFVDGRLVPRKMVARLDLTKCFENFSSRSFWRIMTRVAFSSSSNATFHAGGLTSVWQFLENEQRTKTYFRAHKLTHSAMEAN